ncbi:hypothetical protein NSS79_15260 [Paenibacillus sp. FSL L8-0436]|uniref:hypothetical protein n=1 Tax=Paenibacillus sp. FSL L8-0436 TaxID=2954686 RepID=UPI00315866FB
MKRFSDKLSVVLIIILIVTISLNILNGWKGKQLNQRYEDSHKQYEESIEQYVQANREYIEYLKSSRERLEIQLRKADQAAVN